jgi:uncharacterized protein (DUF849 family)
MTWLEVALNGGWGRKAQPRSPVTVAGIVADGIACAREGAAIVHLHAYDEAAGRQHDDPDLYARIIEGIRSQVDAIVYPTIDGAVAPGSELSMTGPARYRAVEVLARRGLLEWSVVDPGSVNISARAALADPSRRGSVYLNTESDIRTGLAHAARFGLHPSFAIYEPGFVRLGAALAALHPGLPAPVYRLMFSDGLAFGFPPRPYALDAYRALLAEHAPGAPWMIAGLMCDVTPLIEMAVQHGGHVRTGLEDVRLGSELGNPELVRGAAAAIRAAGGTLATPAEIRAALARPPRASGAPR